MSPEEARSLASVFIASLERESETTRRVLAAMPEDRLDFKLGDKGRTARELMWHTAVSEAWFAAGIESGDFAMGDQPPEPPTVAGIVEWYDQNVPAAIAKVKGLPAEHLAKPIPFFGLPPIPIAMYLQFWLVHSVHHRGQLSTYLRAMNARVPDIYGGSADEPYQAPATA